VKASALLMAAALLVPEQSLAQQGSLPWRGSVKEQGNKYVLSIDGTELEATQNDVESTNGKTFIKIGSNLTIIKTPPPFKTQVQTSDPSCPNNGPTFCAGLVEVCCGNGHVLRACIGVWGCR
jgi:hypothetical protein